MDVTVKQISEWARQSMTVLAHDPRYGNLTSVYAVLSRTSGLSESWVAKFYQGAKPNPTQDTLDRLVLAIKSASKLEAA